MSCHEISTLLDDHLDGELDTVAAAQVAAHVAVCPACRDELAGLAAARDAMAALPHEVAPTCDLWPGIATAIERQTIVMGGFGRTSRALPRWLTATAAAAVLVLATATVTWHLAAGSRSAQVAAASREAATVPASLGDGGVTASFAMARRNLLVLVEQRRASLDLETARVVDDNLRIIDGAVSRIEAALARDPGNPGLQRLLLTAYRQELDLLKAVLG